MRELLLLVVLCACGAEADEPVAEPDVASDATPDEPEHVTPLCAGEDEPLPGECQTLVYGDKGYCNRWAACVR